MSVQAMTWVLEEAPDLPAHLLGTLVGLANHADRHGCGSHPGQDTLAWYSRKSDRAVRKDLTQLLELGLIREGDQRLVEHVTADRRPVVYDLAVERKREKRDDRNHSSSRDRNHSSGRSRRTTGTTVPPATGTTVPGGTTVPAGTTGSNDRNSRVATTGTTVPGNQVRNRPEPYSPSGSSARVTHARTPARTRGTRIPDDFAVTPEMVEWARTSTPDVDGRYETQKFINYWQSKAGKDATKVDWTATWRNWMLRAQENGGTRRGGNRRPSTTDQRVADTQALKAKFTQPAIGGHRRELPS